MKIPKEIAEMKLLDSLMMDNNNISELPLGLTKLKYVSLKNNMFRTFSPSLFSSKDLWHIDLRFNRLNYISKEIQNLTNLKMLHLEKNQLTD